MNTGIDKVKRFYKYYTQDFSYKDIESFFKHDAPEAYDFYVKKIKHKAQGPKSFSDRIIFVKDLFLEFLMQLTPGRRIIYTAAVFLFFLGYFNGLSQLVLISFVLINLLIAFELADKLTARNELAVAREIQAGLMPMEAPVNKYYDICGYSESAKEVGGDYFDFIEDENNTDLLHLVIGDISGKGMAAAIHMVQVRSVLHNVVLNHDSPKTILTSLNRNLKKVFRAGSFFTVSIASLISDKQIKLCRAGHLPLIYYSRKEEKCSNIIPRGIGIGLTSNNLFERTLEEISIEPSSGDVLVFYTDGIVEAMNEYFQEFGEHRLMHVIQQNAYKNSPMIKEAILDSVQLFMGAAPRHDDLTMIVMKTL